MKAAVCTRYGPAAEVLRIADLEKPVPKPNEVRIRIRATVVTGSDVIVRGSRISPTLWLPMRIVIGFRGPRNPILGSSWPAKSSPVGGTLVGSRRATASSGRP